MLKMPETESLPRVYLVGGDMTWNGEITETLDGRYVVWSSGDHVKALDEMSSVPPDAVILEENMPPKGASYFLGLRRGIERLKNVPFIITGERGAKRIQAVFLEGDTYLSWPCTDQELLSEVAKAINTTVERSWEKLPEIQRKPLKMTVETYHNISEAVAKDEPVDYAEAAESCQALVEAVQSNQHNALLDLVQAHHSYTYVHSMRVATLLTLFGNGIGMSEDEVLTLTTGGLLHDIGKLLVPVEILEKPGKLDEDEWLQVKKHVEHSMDFLPQNQDMAKGIRIIAEQHHEKLDGTGYPKGLRNGEVNTLARMAAIADIFGALTDKRSYKPPMEPEKAFGILEDMSSAIDRRMLKVFQSIFMA